MYREHANYLNISTKVPNAQHNDDNANRVTPLLASPPSPSLLKHIFVHHWRTHHSKNCRFPFFFCNLLIIFADCCVAQLDHFFLPPPLKSSTAIGGRERLGHQATQRDNQPNKRGAMRGGGVMRGGGTAKAPDNMKRRNATTNEWRGAKRGGGAG